MNEQESRKIISNYIKKHGKIETLIGCVKINHSDILGQGGNGIVYLGNINKKEIAIKILTNCTSKKIERFKAEYLNVNIVREKLKNVVNSLQYGILVISDNEFPYILMNKYEKSLKKFRKELKHFNWNELSNLFNSLCVSLESIQNCGMIHRDLKPENILINQKGDFIITDFGIANYSEEFPINNLTSKGERLANFEFCAPEQLNDTKVTFATDIYSFAQIVYWFVFGEVNRGTGGKHIHSMFDEKEAIFFDSIIYKCLSNNPNDRFQSISEIYEELDILKSKSIEIDIFDDMRKLSRIVRSTVPEFYQNVHSCEDKKEINELIAKISKEETNKPFEFSTGTLNDTITNIKALDNGNYLLNDKEINIVRIWGTFSISVYDDVLIFEVEPVKPYIIDGIEYSGVAVIENDLIVPIEKVESGYIRYKGEVQSTAELDIEERYIHYDSDRYFAIGAFQQCSVLMKNDKYINSLQSFDKLDSKTLINLVKQIRKNKSFDVSMRM